MPRRVPAQGFAGIRAAAGGGAAMLLVGLGACTAAVPVEAAPYASEPVCGQVLQRAPDELLGLARRTTTSQASRAWGNGEPIVLRCGVEPPGPSTERCVRVAGAAGEPVDWLAVEGPHEWVFVTYGRTPAVEVTVPFAALRDNAQPTAPLIDLAPAIGVTSVGRTCL